jgi:hypothetical protein
MIFSAKLLLFMLYALRQKDWHKTISEKAACKMSKSRAQMLMKSTPKVDERM